MYGKLNIPHLHGISPKTQTFWDLEDKEKERRRRRHGAVIRSVASGHVLSVAGMDYLSGEGGNFHPVGSQHAE